MNKNYFLGISYALLTAVISGFAIFYNQKIVVQGIDSLIFNIVRNGGVAIVLTLLIFRSANIRKKFIRLNKSQWLKLLIIAVIGGSVPFVLFFDGLKTVAATNSSMIHKSLFIWVSLLAIPILGERLHPAQVIGFLIIGWSNFFLPGIAKFTGNLGEIKILTATLLWSLEYIIAKITLRNTESKIVAWGRMFMGSIILIGFAVWQNKIGLLTTLTLNQLYPVITSVIFLTGYVLTWYKALKLAPATLVTSILIISVPITNILTMLTSGSKLPQVQLVQLVTIPVALYLVIKFIPTKTVKTEDPQ